MFEFESPILATDTTTAWFPAGLEFTVQIIDDDVTDVTVHTDPPIVTLVWPETKFDPEIVNA